MNLPDESVTYIIYIDDESKTFDIEMTMETESSANNNFYFEAGMSLGFKSSGFKRKGEAYHIHDVFDNLRTIINACTSVDDIYSLLQDIEFEVSYLGGYVWHDSPDPDPYSISTFPSSNSENLH